jgi:hypothetical protein
LIASSVALANVVVGADAVHSAGEHKPLIVGGVACQKECGAIILNQNGEMIRRVTGRGDGDNAPRLGQSPAGGERTKRFRRKVER